MTPNKSLQLSHNIENIIRNHDLEYVYNYLPLDYINEIAQKYKQRNRVFTLETTLMTMMLTAAQDNKALSNSVSIYNTLHKKNQRDLEARKKAEEAKEAGKKKRGRPRKQFIEAAKSQQQSISLNTSAYSQARTRLPVEITKECYQRTAIAPVGQSNLQWHKMPVFIVDGTYFNMSDSPELRKKYGIRQDYTTTPPYPQGLLTVMIHQGSGKIVTYRKTSRSTSELTSFYQMIDEIPKGSIVLADALYNTYATFSKLIEQGIHLLTKGQADRKYKVIKNIGKGDDIVEIEQSARPKWLPKEAKLPERLQLRRIEVESLEEEEKTTVYYTTLIDYEEYSQASIATKFTSRWDIEISIREVKILMEMEFLRGKTETMIEKEINVSLAMYNIIREIIAKSAEKGAFSPEEVIFQTMLKSNQTILVDKKGRVYSRWSPGRYGNVTPGINELAIAETTGGEKF